MDLTLSDTQQQILDSVGRILERHGGRNRNRVQVEKGEYDQSLHDALAHGGFFDLAHAEDAGPLEAALVVERVAEDGPILATAATALVFPMVVGEAAPGPVALSGAEGRPFRLGQFASAILVLDGDVAKRLDPKPGELSPVDNDHAGWPLARLSAGALSRAKSLGPGSGEKLRNWQRVGVALEIAGAMRGALRTTTNYVKDRVQFGRPIGSFQSIQHRLAHLAVQVEGAYWAALEAAYKSADPLLAAGAAAFATQNAPAVLRETQQMHGAIGFTREYPLHLWTMKLPALQRELGGSSQHARAAARLLAEARAQNQASASGSRSQL